MTTYDYLGLLGDERINEAARAAITRFGTGGIGSRIAGASLTNAANTISAASPMGAAMLGRTVGDLGRLARMRGPAAGPEAARAVRDGLRQRAEVDARCVVDRAAVEARWFL